MLREVSYPVGIVLERRPSQNKWVDHSWQVVDLILDPPAMDGWQELPTTAPGEADDGVRRFCYGPVFITLHRRMGEAYDHNILTGHPAVWVMLDDLIGETVPYRFRGVTVDPFEAQGFLDCAEGLIERLPMPEAIRAWMAGYMQEMPEPEQFKKRKRVTFKREEEQKFGKDPIFSPQGRKS
ncbi:DUF3305 domain-containing protein [Roseibium aestuarii]|uniref:DUF3305 domain-containing protein n=1 Tax=Roseibium aestuarii TaxID=2600299 RepID=A0ABW4JT21_9HYPH|nr:DUF3305 domain-containing protein [Roseibium aestuarii]